MDPKITEIIPTEMKTSKENLHIATYSESGNTGNKSNKEDDNINKGDQSNDSDRNYNNSNSKEASYHQ